MRFTLASIGFPIISGFFVGKLGDENPLAPVMIEIQRSIRLFVLAFPMTMSLALFMDLFHMILRSRIELSYVLI